MMTTKTTLDSLIDEKNESKPSAAPAKDLGPAYKKVYVKRLHETEGQRVACLKELGEHVASHVERTIRGYNGREYYEIKAEMKGASLFAIKTLFPDAYEAS